MHAIDRQTPGATRHRTKRRITLWLTPDTLTTLQARARDRHLPVCEQAERFIRRGLELSTAHQLEETALPLLTEAVRLALEEHARQSEDRLAKLLTRTLIHSDTTRRLLFSHMARQWGGGEQIRQVHDAARTASINALKDRGWAAALRLDVEDLDA